jgi:hypothetical protein
MPELGDTAVNIDWLRYTVPWKITDLENWEKVSPSQMLTRALELAVMPVSAFRPDGEEKRGILNYNRRYPMTAGSLMLHTERPEQKIMIDIPGEGCAKYREMGITDYDMLDYVRNSDARIARLDIALDWYGQGSPLDIRDAHNQGKTRTGIRNTTEVVERSGNGKIAGTTVYFGSNTSDSRVRVYNKRAQMQTDYPWLRVEATIKGEKAVSALNALLGRSIDDAGRAIIRSIIDTQSVQWWVKAMTGPLIEIEPLGRKETDTDKWLLGVVRDKLEERLLATMAEEDFGLYDAFLSTLEHARKDTFD